MSDVSAQVFGENVAQRRQEAGITQEELAHRAGVHRTEIGLLERGERQPRLSTIVMVAGALEVDPCELIRGLTWTPPSTEPGSLRRS